MKQEIEQYLDGLKKAGGIYDYRLTPDGRVELAATPFGSATLGDIKIDVDHPRFRDIVDDIVRGLIVERLRAHGSKTECEAADEIERLRADRARLVEALRKTAFRTNNDWPQSKTCLICGASFSGAEYHKEDCAIAKATGEA